MHGGGWLPPPPGPAPAPHPRGGRLVWAVLSGTESLIAAPITAAPGLGHLPASRTRPQPGSFPAPNPRRDGSTGTGTPALPGTPARCPCRAAPPPLRPGIESSDRRGHRGCPCPLPTTAAIAPGRDRHPGSDRSRCRCRSRRSLPWRRRAPRPAPGAAARGAAAPAWRERR